MAFHASLFNVGPDVGYSATWVWDTVVQTTASGHETRIQRRSQGRRRCEAMFSLRNAAAMATIETFWNARRGAEHSFPWKDISDYASTPDRTVTTTAVTNVDQVLGTGDGTRTVFQLVKVYDDGVTNPWTRRITLPISGTVVVALNGVNQASGWSVNTATGEITFSVAPALGVVVTAGFQHYIPVRFDESVDPRRKIDVLLSANAIPVVMWEVLDEVEYPDTVPSGGYLKVVLAADRLIDPSEAVFYEFDVTAGNFRIYLPPTGPIPGGGPIHRIYISGGGGHTIDLLDHEGSSVATGLAIGSYHEVFLDNDGTNAQWRVV